MDAFARAFGEVRSALAARPVDPDALWDALTRSHEADPTRHAEVVAPYGEAHRAHVPGGLRRVDGLDELPRHVAIAPFATFDLRVVQRLGSEAEARERFEACEGIERVSRLVLSHTRLDPDNVEALCALHLPELEQLDVSYNRLGEPGLEALAQAEWLKQVRVLGLHDARLHDDAMEVLRHPGALELLEELDVSKNALSAAGANLLFSAPFVPRLRALNVSWNPITDVGVSALCRALTGRDPVLESLGMCDAKVTAQGAALLANMAALANVRRLDLRANTMGDGVERLADSVHLGNVRDLALATNRIGVRGAVALARSPHLTRLEELERSWNLFGDEGVRALARSENMSRVHTLGLFDVGATSEAARALAASTHLSNLRRLNLGSNRLGDEGVRALVASEVCVGLERLDVSTCGLTDAGVEALASAPALANLNTLIIHGNTIGERGIRALADSPHLVGLRRSPTF